MRKRIFALLMVICLVFTMAAGCGSAPDEGNDAGGGQTETPTGDQQTETHEMYTADNVTDEMMQEL